MESDLRDALKFVRGRVHHAFADAIEFRDDVPLPLGPATGSGARGPVLIADWCWCDAANLAGGQRDTSARSDRSRETAYQQVLAGRQVRAALDQVAELAAQLYNEL